MPNIPITYKKSRWAKNRDVTLRGSPLNYNAALQKKYERQLLRLVREMTSTVKKQILRLFNSETGQEFFAMDASLSSQAKILMNALTQRFSQLFSSAANSLAQSMVLNSQKISKTVLHDSLQKLSGGLSLKTGIITEGTEEIAKASIAENVSLIKSIPSQYFNAITGSVMRSITTGKGLADLIPDINKYQGQTLRRARNIALDQTRKAYSSINKQKLEALGSTHFEWLHSGGGQHPRESHIKISGHIFSFENLYAEQEALGVPKEDQGIPGHPVNCKCVMIPVIKFGGE